MFTQYRRFFFTTVLTPIIFVFALFPQKNPSLTGFTRPFLIEKMEFHEINTWYYLYIKKSLAAAEKAGADVIILEIDTPGGQVDITLKIINRLVDLEIPLVVYVNKNAVSAGAILALTGTRIFINSAGIIGASTPVYMSSEGVKNAPEKNNSVIRATFRTLAEKSNRPVKICEAMVDEEIELSEKNDGYNLAKGKLLTLTSEEAVRLGIADAVVSSRADVYRLLGIEENSSVSASVSDRTNSEKETVIKKYNIPRNLKFLNFVSNPVILGLLMTLGVLGLIFEIKTPGWGVGGTIGILCLSAFFIIQILLENAGWQAPALFAVGLVLLLLEIFIIPGFGLPGIIGITAILAGFVLSFGIENWQSGLNVLALSFAAIIAGVILIVKFFPETALFSRFALNYQLKETIQSDSSAPAHAIIPGSAGTAVTPLRPVGKAVFNGIVLEVQSDLGFINQGSSVCISRIENNRYFVSIPAQPGSDQNKI